METISRVVVIGGGELGSAVGVLLKKNNVTADLWDTDPSVVPGQKPLQEIVPAAECVAFCVPSWAMRAIKRAIYQGMRNDLRTNLDLISSHYAVATSLDEVAARLARLPGNTDASRTGTGRRRVTK